MALQGLGYAGFGSDALDDWRQFGTGLLGLQAVERGNSLLAFLDQIKHVAGAACGVVAVLVVEWPGVAIGEPMPKHVFR